jgi:hypothetical protein
LGQEGMVLGFKLPGLVLARLVLSLELE